MYRAAVVYGRCFVWLLACGMLVAEETQPLAPVQPEQVSVADKPADATMIELLILVVRPPDVSAEPPQPYWEATIVEAQTTSPKLAHNQRIQLRMQVPNVGLGEPGSLAHIVVRLLPGDESDTPIWEVIGLPEMKEKPKTDEQLPLPDPERFVDKLADMVDGEQVESTAAQPATAEVVNEAQVGELLGAAEEPVSPENPPARDTSSLENEPAESESPDGVGPSLPPQPLKSTGLVLGGNEHVLIEYEGPLRTGAAFAVSLANGEETGDILVLEVDGRFALVSGAVFAAGDRIQLAQDAQE